MVLTAARPSEALEAVESGTTCCLALFILSCGSVHNLRSKSTSAQRGTFSARRCAGTGIIGASRGKCRHRRILRLRQRAPPSSGARLWRADGRLARRRGAGSLWTCGQRKRVDHMPTGGSESAADRTLGGLIKDNQKTAFQLNRRQKRSRCAGPFQFVELVTESLYRDEVGPRWENADHLALEDSIV
jgi:hypothetical protein